MAANKDKVKVANVVGCLEADASAVAVPLTDIVAVGVIGNSVASYLSFKVYLYKLTI